MLLLSRSEIASLLGLPDYIQVVEDAFRRHAEGRAFEPALAHVDADGGEFHIKAGGLHGTPPYFVLKVNGGFFQNQSRFGLPNIQGLIILSRGDNGAPLAAMDSIEITIQRTGAVTAVAAKYLARPSSRVCTICGCGNQGRIQIRALRHALPIERVFAWSPYPEESVSYAKAMTKDLGIDVSPVIDLSAALRHSDVCITCTPSRRAFIRCADIPPGMFIAAIGADSPDKQELDPQLVASSTVVADLRAQSITVGEAHHAIAAGLMRPEQLHAELGQIIAGKSCGRTSDEEVVIFDSTGTALQDVAAAAAIYERALQSGAGIHWAPGN